MVLTSLMEQRYLVLDAFTHSHVLVPVIQQTESISNVSSVFLHHGYDDVDVDVDDNDASLTFPLQTFRMATTVTRMYNIFDIVHLLFLVLSRCNRKAYY